MICKYCELIHSKDEAYPLREATRDLNSDFPRCDWHWRFMCDICGKPRHFNGIMWCEKSKKFTCIFCGKDHRFLKGEFWNWTAYYAIGCPHCKERHPALDRLEFQGEHPWQLHPEMLSESVGLSAERENKGVTIRNFLSKDSVISDETVGEAWDRIADMWHSRYAELGDVNRQYVIDPAILKILGEVKEKKILDAGCGNGYLCRLLSQKGAEMVGVDISEKAINIAQISEKKEPMNIKYFVGSICNLSMCSDNIFDFVVSNIVLCDLQDLDKAIKEVHRVLKPGSKLVFSILHPCFSSPPVCGWVRKPVDSQRKEDWLHCIVDRYFDRSIEESPVVLGLPPTYGFHRPLSDYMKVLMNNGFAITDFEEPVPTAKDTEEHYRHLNDCERVPWFLVIGAVK